MKILRPICLGSICLSLVLGASACTHYAPRPVDLSAIAAQRERRALDLGQAATTCRRLAPKAECNPSRLDRAMLYAAMFDTNPAIAAARQHVLSAVAAARSAKQAPGPKLTLTTEYAGAAPDPSPWLLGASSEIPLDIGGARAVRIGSAELAVVTARYDLAETVWSARMTLVRGLAQLFVADRQNVAASELVAIQERRFAAMERRVNAGEASRAELERVRADLADARHRHADADARREAGLVEIANAIGVSPAALAGAAFAWDGFEAPQDVTRVSADERRIALLARADLLKSMVAYDQAELDLRGEVAKQYPAITVGPGFTWERGLVKIPFNLGLSLPPFDLNRKAIAAATARRSEAAAKLEADYAAAIGAVDGALGEADAAQRALDEFRRLDLPIAARLAAQADRELAAGSLDRADWGAAQAGRLTTRLLELDALARALTADLALEDALRRPLSGPELMIGRGEQ